MNTKRSAALIIILSLIAIWSPAMVRADETATAPATDAHAINRALGRGINLGNMLEAPVEGQWGVKLEPAFIDIAAREFTTVRLPVRWSNHAAKTEDATLDEAFAADLERRLAAAVRELAAIPQYDYLVVNHPGRIEEAAAQIEHIMLAERCRVNAPPVRL